MSSPEGRSSLSPRPAQASQTAAATEMPLLSAHGIQVVRDRRTILDVPSIEIKDGEVLAVIGPNGAGKTTLLSVLSCLEHPTKGEVLHRGNKVTRREVLSVRRKMAVVFQEPLLLDGTVLENVMLGMRLRGKGEEGRRSAAEWLERFGIAAVAGQTRNTLSAGEAQRASLARAFALEPEILFMDEPFTAVDVISRRGLIEEFRQVQRSVRTTTVLITHDFSEVAMLASRVLVLHNGVIQAEGSPDQIEAHEKWGLLARGGEAGASPI
ncbi:MAG: ABC transporter ATP-binding protein [Bacillota bacterium]